MNEPIRIREARPEDLEEVTRIEAACFPEEKAAGRDRMQARLAAYPSHFLILEAEGRAAGFVNGIVSGLPDLEDRMFEDASMHEEDGDWQMVFGLDVLPEFRGRGYARRLMEACVARARREGRKGVVLTCRPGLVEMYSKFGFVDEGLSASTHGGVPWHQMRITF